MLTVRSAAIPVAISGSSIANVNGRTPSAQIAVTPNNNGDVPKINPLPVITQTITPPPTIAAAAVPTVKPTPTPAPTQDQSYVPIVSVANTPST